MRARILVFASVVVWLAAACGDDSSSSGSTQKVEGSGTIAVEEREVAAFDRVDLRGDGIVLVGEGTDGIVEIETDDNLLGLIRVDVRDGQLVIETQSRTDLEPTGTVTYRTACPPVTGVSLRGSGTIRVGSCATDEALELEVSGSGMIAAGGVDIASLDVDISGSGQVAVDGAATTVHATLSGSGTIDASDLRAERVDASIPGSGDITVWATDTLDAHISGSGSIRYHDDPSVTQNVSGSGAVQPLGTR